MKNVPPSELLRLPPQPLPDAAAVRMLSGLPGRMVSSRALFGGDREIGIEHAGALYRLKITRQGKLILNK